MAAASPIDSRIGYHFGPFWTLPEQIGSTAEEARAFAEGTLDIKRVGEIELRMQMLANSLNQVAPAGVQDWMSPRRAMS